MAQMPSDRRTVHFRLVCERPPGAEFGLQDKQEHLHPGAPQPDGSVVYLFGLEAAPGQAQEIVRWRGPFVHGRPPAPFLYLSLRRDGGAPTEWAKRIKVPLRGITATQVETASKTDGAVLEGRVSGKGSGTVALLGDGWQVRDNAYAHS